MQGIVFTYRNKRERVGSKISKLVPELRRTVKKWGSVIIFSVTLVAGLACGCFTAGGLKPETLRNLDFFFTTNMPERLSGGALNAFAASFGSDFLFLLSAFLLGLSLWGIAVLPFLAFAKGYGIGVSAGYLLISYGLKGIVFYLVVILPGALLFSFALIYELSSAYYMFRRLFGSVFLKNSVGFKEPLKKYTKRGLKYLIVTFAASLIDTALWQGLAGIFF